MRQYFFLFAAMLAIAAGCVREMEESSETGELTFTASFDSDTKVTVNNSGKVTWYPYDGIGIYDGRIKGYAQINGDKISSDGKSASFSAYDLSLVPKYYAVHPYQFGGNVSPDADGFIHLNYVPDDRPEKNTYKTCCAVAGSDRSFRFKNAYCLIRVVDPPYYVKFSSDVTLAKEQLFNPETGEMKPVEGSGTLNSFFVFPDNGKLLTGQHQTWILLGK